MGLYDTIIANGTCPWCGSKMEFYFQTKQLDRILKVYRIGHEVKISGFEIKEGKLTDAFELCPECEGGIEGEFEIKHGRITKLVEVRKNEPKTHDWFECDGCGKRFVDSTITYKKENGEFHEVEKKKHVCRECDLKGFLEN